MAEYRVIYSDSGIVKKELDFKGSTFTLTMIPDEAGSTSREKNFEIQVVEKFGDFEDEVLAIIGDIAFADEFEVQNYLEELSYYEKIF